jgi:glycosyltransferase involved in cell wall biosynthesis
MKSKVSVISPSIRPKGLEITRQSLLKQTFTDFEWITDINWTGKHDLNKALNRCIKRSSGELIVILQDYIKIQPNALQGLWDAYTASPDTLFTCPVGKVNNETYMGKPKWDWRNSPQAQMDWRMWEIDFGACPRDVLFKLGGFDEEIDGFWSCDNLNVGCRADLAGYKFARLINIKGIAFDHDAFMEHPFRKDYKPIFNNMRMDEFRQGLKIDFLNS